MAASGVDAEKHSTQLEKEEELLTAQMWWGKDDLGSGKRDWLDKRTPREVAGGSTRKFRDVDRDVMQQRHWKPGENGVGFQLP